MRKAIVIFLFSISLTTFGRNYLSTANNDSIKQQSFLSQVPYESVNGKIIVNVKIKGKSYRFILDTGSLTLISKRLYNELNPKIIQKVSVEDQSALKESMNIVSLDEITIGNLEFNNIESFALIESNPLIECFNVDGFIGSNLLSSLIVQISSPEKKIVLTNDLKKLKLDGKQSSELVLDGQSNPYFYIKVKNNKNGKQQLVLFDTGDSELYTLSNLDFPSIKDNKILKINGVTNGSNSIGINGHAIDTIHFRLEVPILEIHGLQFKNVSTTTNQGSSRIGSRLLEHTIVTLDFRNKRYYLQSLSLPEIDVYENKLPFDPDFRNGKVVVGFIWDYSKCKKMEVGDEIIQINEYNFQNISPCDLFTTELSFKHENKFSLTTKDKNGVLQNTTFKFK